MGRDREPDKRAKDKESTKAKDRDRDRDRDRGREEVRTTSDRGRRRDEGAGDASGDTGRRASSRKPAEEAKASARSSAKSDVKAVKQSSSGRSRDRDPKRAKDKVAATEGKNIANGKGGDGHKATTSSKTKKANPKLAKEDRDGKANGNKETSLAKDASDAEEPPKKRKVEEVKDMDVVSSQVEKTDKIAKADEKASKTKEPELEVDLLDVVVDKRSEEPKRDKPKLPEQAEKTEKSRRGPMAAASLDVVDGAASVAGSEGSRSYSPGGSSSYSGSADGARKRKREGLRGTGAGGFSAPLAPPPPPPLGASGAGAIAGGPAPAISTALAPFPDKVRGLIDSSRSLAMEVARMKQAVEAASLQPPSGRGDFEKSESKESVLKMPPRLTENLLHPDNRARLLARTGLESAALNEDGLVVVRAASRKALAKALAQLRRVAYHCQWGSGPARVAGLLADRPAKPVQTMVVRLAATSSRLQSFEARLTFKVRKLRIGTQAGACQMVVEGIPGLSRKHCTITFEPEKGACYVQDLSTNGSYFNGKRLPRPPYKNQQDARVRVFHGDELFFRLRTDDAEELGYVINLLELS